MSSSSQTLKDFLASDYPELALEWDTERNLSLGLDIAKPRMTLAVWWKCSKDSRHCWQTTTGRRIRGSGCLYCAGKMTLTGVNDIGTLYPALTEEWDLEKNTKHYSELLEASNYKAHWICKTDQEHRWIQRVCNRTRRNFGCPYCAGKHVIKGVNDLASQAPHLVEQWHPTKNDCSPDGIHLSSNKKVWWRCALGHEWLTSPNARVSGPAEQGCPYCTNKRAWTGFNDLVTSNPDLARQWHPTKNGNLTPERVMAGSGQRVWWQCSEGHSWETQVNDRNFYGTGCPVCSGHEVLIGFNDLASKEPTLAAEWHVTKNAPYLPTEFTVGSSHKAWWKCDKGHEWKAVIAARSNRGDGCPKCCTAMTSKIEQALLQAVKQTYITAESSRVRLDSYVRPIQIDILIAIDDPANGTGHPIAIEYDGVYWHTPDKVAQRDLEKTEALLKAGYRVIRVREESSGKRLVFLPICDRALTQLSYQYSSKKNDVTELMRKISGLI